MTISKYFNSARLVRQLMPYLVILPVVIGCRSIKPNSPPSPSEDSLPPKAVSSANIPIVIPLTYIERNLNKVQDSKLFAEKGLSIGSGLLADMDVTRTGKISLKALDNNRISVKIPMNLKGDLKIEKRVFGQNLSTSFPFNEQLSPEISFTPEIGRNWDLNIKNLDIDNWGKSLSYNLLGFEINLDPLVRGQLKKVMDNQLASSNLTKLDFKQMAQETWNAFGAPYTVQQEGLSMHFYTKPEKIKLKESITLDQNLVFYIGLEGEVFSKVGTLPDLKAAPLPNIYYNEDTLNRLDITFPLTLKFTELDGYLNNALDGQAIRLDKATLLLPSNLKTQQYGDKTLLSMDFVTKRTGKKDIQGKIYIAGKPVYDEESESLKFEQPEFDVQTGNFFTNTAIRMKKGKVKKQLNSKAAYPLGDFLRKTRREMQQQGYFETDFATFRVKQPTLDISGIYQTAEDIRVYFHATGQMDVRLLEQ
jgi:hypothetical protein